MQIKTIMLRKARIKKTNYRTSDEDMGEVEKMYICPAIVEISMEVTETYSFHS